MFEELQQIITKTDKKPSMVNPDSKFVVVTYWWGRGNQNANTARPCISFYEKSVQQVIKYFINLINTTVVKNNDDEKIPKIIQNIFSSYKKGKTTYSYTKIINDISKNYLNLVYDYCKIEYNAKNKDETAMIILEKMKRMGKTPIDYEYKNEEYVNNFLEKIFKYIVLKSETEITQLFLVNHEVSKLKKKFIETRDEVERNNIKAKFNEYEINKKDFNNRLKTKLKIKMNHQVDSGFSDNKYNNTNIIDILNMECRYLNPLTFEEMINGWELECRKIGCNFMSVEYPEFAQPGGYQLAINAKPLFIKKALELCAPRGVLYIDGDMYVRKYPNIFDMPDVDFMARGWWIDPRASYQMNDSIMYDPYTFETSGGTMFFSQSKEATFLINKWVTESSKKYNEGKADDRILSLVFNTNKLLCNMKLIQLPVEYLWLTLDYDERMLELYDFSKISQSIFIEHPECLTSEDSAAGAGASSDRTPKFYSFLEELTPTSEVMHEYIFFPNKEMTSAFRDYFDYMSDVQYIDDGNEELITKGYVDPDNPLNNEPPFYVIKYDDRLGNNIHSSGEYDDTNTRKLTINEIADINMRSATSMNIDDLTIEQIQPNLYEIKNIDKIDIYNSLEFVFVPNIDSFVFSNFFKPTIELNQPMLFCPGNDILIKFLSMFLSFEDLSYYLHNGSYEFMSRIRVGYLFAKKERPLIANPQNMIGGQVDKYIDEYEKGLEEVYSHGGRKKTSNRIKKTRNNKHKNKRRTRKHKK